MKRLFPSLSDFFATWASAGQYSTVAELELADEASPAANKVHVLPRSSRPAAKSGPASHSSKKKFG